MTLCNTANFGPGHILDAKIGNTLYQPKKMDWQDIHLTEREEKDLTCFSDKASNGEQAFVLLTGSCDISKTRIASYLSRQLAKPLMHVDCSRVLKKFVGETEKNLLKIFAEAKNADAVLFFDEADALFGKRSEVKDSHDKYSQSETTYLLDFLSDYSGSILFAVDGCRRLDHNAVRRMHAIVKT